MRAVTTATAAAVLGVSPKFLDSLLRRVSHDAIPPGRQGLERRIPVAVLAELLLVTELTSRLEIPARRALELVQAAAEERHPGTGRFLSLRADVESARAEVDRRLEVAIESVARPPRGRPRRRRP